MIDPVKVLAGIPAGLRDPLFASFREIASNYTEGRWEPSELNRGKFCEAAYTIIDGSIAGTFAVAPSKPRNMGDACRALERQTPDSARVGDHSLRILIPRMLVMLYEFRNKRGVGHIGGDVNPNFLDATAVYAMASWVFGELVRIFHKVSTDVAQKAVDAIIERKHPLVWETGGVRRVLEPEMSAKDQVLILAYGAPDWVSVADLCKSVEAARPSDFRTRVLKRLHDQRLIEFDTARQRVKLSPRGAKDVETRLLKSRA